MYSVSCIRVIGPQISVELLAITTLSPTTTTTTTVRLINSKHGKMVNKRQLQCLNLRRGLTVVCLRICL